MTATTSAGHTSPSTRLPDAILERYRAGDSIEHLARDYAIPLEQVEWGLGVGSMAPRGIGVTGSRCNLQAGYSGLRWV